MKKYVFAFLILMLSLPVHAENINQLLHNYGYDTTNTKSYKNAEKLRVVQAQYAESKARYCESMAREWNKAEGKSGKSPLVYYDHMTGECVMPDTSSGPDVIFIAPLYGRW